MLDGTLDSLLAGFSLRTGWIFLEDEKDRKLRLAAHRGISPEYLSLVRERGLGECLCCRVFETGHGGLALNRTDCPRMPSIGDGLEQPVAHASVPLAFNGTSRGVLNLAAPHDRQLRRRGAALPRDGRPAAVPRRRGRAPPQGRASLQPGGARSRRAQQGDRHVARSRGRARGGRPHGARDRARRPRPHPPRLRRAAAQRGPRRRPAPPRAQARRRPRPDGDGRQPAPPRARAAGAARDRGLGARPQRQQGDRAALGGCGGAHPAARGAPDDAGPARAHVGDAARVDRGPDRRGRGARLAGLGRPRERAALREGAPRLPRAERGPGADHPEREDGGRRHVRLRPRPRGAQPAELDRAAAVDPRAPRQPAPRRRRRRDQGARRGHPRGGEAPRQPRRRLPAVLAQQPGPVPPDEPGRWSWTRSCACCGRRRGRAASPCGGSGSARRCPTCAWTRRR